MIRVIETYEEEKYYNECNDGEVDIHRLISISLDGEVITYTVGEITQDGLCVDSIFIHSISDTVWIVAHNKSGGYFEVYVECDKIIGTEYGSYSFN